MHTSNLDGLTYVVVMHNPSYPGLFLVRLANPGSGKMDHRTWRRTRDVLGYGETLDEAAAAALKIRKGRLVH